MRVNASVLVRDPKSGQVTVVNAGEEVPGWAERLIGSHLVDSEPEVEVSEETGADGDDDVDSEREPEVKVEPKKPTARRGRR